MAFLAAADSALAAAEAIEQVSSSPVSVKWPNDLLISGRKVGGILCESGAGMRSRSFPNHRNRHQCQDEHDDWPIDLRSQPRRYGRNKKSSLTVTDCSPSCSSNSNSASMNWPYSRNEPNRIGLQPTMHNHRPHGESDVGQWRRDRGSRRRNRPGWILAACDHMRRCQTRNRRMCFICAWRISST